MSLMNPSGPQGPAERRAVVPRSGLAQSSQRSDAIAIANAWLIQESPRGLRLGQPLGPSGSIWVQKKTIMKATNVGCLGDANPLRISQLSEEQTSMTWHGLKAGVPIALTEEK